MGFILGILRKVPWADHVPPRTGAYLLSDVLNFLRRVNRFGDIAKTHKASIFLVDDPGQVDKAISQHVLPNRFLRLDGKL